MSVFGFIENFFFISLALVFILVLLLVYHFKNRITIAEKKSESMYGLLTAVVKEIKSLRGMFCVGNEQTTPSQSQSPVNFEVKSKTDPEISIDSSSELEQEHLQKKEVITLEFSASEDKIVVSDDSDDDSSNDSSSDSDSESDNDDNSDNEEVLDSKVIQKIHVFENMESTLEEIDMSFDIDVSNTHGNENENENENEDKLTQINDIDEVSHNDSGIEYLVSANENNIIQPTDVEEVLHIESDNTKEQPTHIPTIEQLRKMNINQLKTVVSQVGITADITKLKKPDLISIILTGSN